MILLEKMAKCPCPHASAKARAWRKMQKDRRWLKTKLDDDKGKDIDLDGKSSRGFEGKGGGFGERDGGNTGGITFINQGGGYRPPHTGGS